jgi:hypothetical protein
MYERVQPRHPVQIVIWLAKHAFWAGYRQTGSNQLSCCADY